ncbi:hypothetical protein OH76DRAFT_782440 [Lentinus brumalis]|uniref:Uncharacterized protein n=1 Tax=Lentinus brumalis TaxID=2498619 RepID=A0A371D3V4_9APHY|nr:hypothetical protein OH76DRAFT_782440 [Polyporus brumalis]
MLFSGPSNQLKYALRISVRSRQQRRCAPLPRPGRHPATPPTCPGATRGYYAFTLVHRLARSPPPSIAAPFLRPAVTARSSCCGLRPLARWV